MRVVELSNEEGAAAYAGKLFARWGADVIKVEAPDRQPPERARDLAINGGKRRVAADYHHPGGCEQIGRLAAVSDVLLTDAPAADVKRFRLLDLGGDAGASVRVSLTPFGLSGPYAAFPATSSTLLALGGYSFLMGHEGRAPLTLPECYLYSQAGSYAYVSALACALRAALDTALAPHIIEISLLECLVSLHQYTDTGWLDRGHIRARHGNRMDTAANTMLPVKDGWVGVSIQPQFWDTFTLMLGRPELAEPGHPFATTAGRVAHRDELEAAIIDALKDRTAAEVFCEAQETWRVPIGQLLTTTQVLADRHLSERGFWQPLPGVTAKDGGPLRVPGPPFRFIGEAPPVEQPPVPPGSDTETVLAEVPPPASPSTVPSARRPVPAPTRPLTGYRVLDLTRVWSGPLTGRVLGDLGAHVVKVEAPTGRGPARVPAGTRGYQSGELDQPWNRQTLFNKLHRNREAVCIDLKQREGRALFLRLVAKSDVVLENFSARAMSTLGLGYDALRAANARIIYVPMPAFGRSGPYRDYIGLGTSVEPLSSMPQLLGYEGGPPMSAAMAIPDPIAALAAAAAVVTALERRERTGLGAQVDLSQHEAAVALLGEVFVEQQLTGEEPPRLGNGHRRYAPHGVYRCAGDSGPQGTGPGNGDEVNQLNSSAAAPGSRPDARAVASGPSSLSVKGDHWLALAARDEAEWTALCAAAGQGWEADPRFSTADARLAHRAALDTEIEAWTAGHEKQALMLRLLQAGVPAGAVQSAPEYLADLHLHARGYFAELHHEQTGTHRYDGSPVVVNGERGYDEWTPPPMLGEQNWPLLRDLLGLERAEYERLVAQGILADRPPG